MPVLRQASTNAALENIQCGFCDEDIKAELGHLRLGCRCLVHYGCIVSYVRSKLEDRSTIKERGIPCPYGPLCKAQEEYFLRPKDLQALLRYQSDFNSDGYAPELCEEDEKIKVLTSVEVAKFTKWCEHQQSDEPEFDPEEYLTTMDTKSRQYMEATTKPCPNCHMRATHYHGHECHHVSISVRQKLSSFLKKTDCY